MSKPGRKSETTMPSEVGESRKSKIASMVANGAKNGAIWAAMYYEYPQACKDDVRRAEICSENEQEMVDFDAAEHERLGWAIRQVKGLMIKEDAEITEMMEELGVGETKGADAIEFRNRPRFDCGMKHINELYGTTYYVWTKDAPNSKYEVEEFEQKTSGIDKDGMMVETTTKTKRNIWVSGDYKTGDLMPVEAKEGNWIAKDDKTCKQFTGVPEGYLSLWGGDTGSGKSTTAIELLKACNAKGYHTFYANGEEDEEDFRMKMGPKINGELFHLVSGEKIKLARVVQDVYKHRPKIVVIDSIQMLAEFDKGFRAQKTCLSSLKLLKSDEEAGKPHIILISQLNAKGDLAGRKYLQHIVDGVLTVMKLEGRKGHFKIAIPKKLRGGSTGIERHFRFLTPFGIEEMYGDSRTPLHQLMQKIENPIIEEGMGVPAKAV